MPEASIYHHTHYFLRAHHYLTPEPSNDFAYWVMEVLGEEPLGERLAAIDTVSYATLEESRGALVEAVTSYLQQTPTAHLRFVGEGQEFFFVKSIHVIMPTDHTASTLQEFAAALEEISINSLYFHSFDARLHVKGRTNDFGVWLKEQLGLAALAENVSHLDPYAHTLEALRSILLSLVHQQLAHDMVRA